MTKIALLVAGLLLVPAITNAQAQVSLRLDLPVVLPQLVVVSPGIQVVPDVEEEIFFVDGFYWVRQDSGWYRSRSHRGGWAMVPHRAVPVRVAQLPPGKYRHYRPSPRPSAAPARYERYERGGGDDRDHGDRDHDKGHGKHGKHGKH
jgi:hypothetical protein